MPDDVLNNEVSVGVEASGLSNLPVEVKGKAKSRFVSAIDRFLGNIVDWPNAWLEAGPAKKRAKTEAELDTIKARGEAEADAIRASIGQIVAQNALLEPFVQKAVEQFCRKAVRSQEKKILLLQEAMEDLKQRPPDADEATNGNETLDEGFLNRLEKRVEEATEKEIRSKWGRVLAGEIRRPGTFSAKLMRIVDELEPETAKLFEDICRYRIKNIIPLCLSGALEFSKKKNLENAGLLVTSDQELSAGLRDGTRHPDDVAVWLLSVKTESLAFPKDSKLPNNSSECQPIGKDGQNCMIPSYVLTDEGMALTSILEDRQEETFYAYLKKLSEFLPEVEIDEFKKADNNSVKFIRKWKNGEPLP